MVPVLMCYIIFVIRLFLFYMEWFLYSVLYHICHKVVSVLQEWFLCSVLYHILFLFYRNGSCEQKILCYIIFVITLFVFYMEWFLYYVLYHICHKVVSVLQEWFLYSVLYGIFVIRLFLFYS